MKKRTTKIDRAFAERKRPRKRKCLVPGCRKKVSRATPLCSLCASYIKGKTASGSQAYRNELVKCNFLGVL